jgi:Icc-related predicted phosphoesterase
MPGAEAAKPPAGGYGCGMAMSELDGSRRKLRIAAAGDIHCREANRGRVVAAFAALDGEADLALLAGDLTSHGRVEEAEILCEAVAATAVPVATVLGNHDWHAGRAEEITARLEEAGAIVLDRRATVRQLAGVEVGIVGCKGFVGGFAPHHLPDFGEPSLRAVYAEATAEVEALEAGLQEVATCPLRIVLLHYSPVEATLEGEPREIFAFLGSDRLAAPILEHGPDLVLHGHAHEGAAEGRIGATPVYNVSLPVTGRDFWTIELDARRTHSPIP